jgi:hypothetical protein
MSHYGVVLLWTYAQAQIEEKYLLSQVIHFWFDALIGFGLTHNEERLSLICPFSFSVHQERDRSVACTGYGGRVEAGCCAATRAEADAC